MTDKHDFSSCPFCGKPVKYVGYKVHNDGFVIGYVAGCSGNCGWEMASKSFSRLRNKVNKRPTISRD